MASDRSTGTLGCQWKRLDVESSLGMMSSTRKLWQSRRTQRTGTEPAVDNVVFNVFPFIFHSLVLVCELFACNSNYKME